MSHKLTQRPKPGKDSLREVVNRLVSFSVWKQLYYMAGYRFYSKAEERLRHINSDHSIIPWAQIVNDYNKR